MTSLMAVAEVAAAGEGEKLVGVRHEPVRHGQQRGEPVEVLRAAGVQHVDGDEHAVAPGRPGDVRQVLAGQPGERVRGADEQGPAVLDGVQVDVGAGEQPRRARDVEGGPLAVRPDGQDGGRRLGVFFADQPGGVHAVPGHRGDHDVAEQVVAERADGAYPGARAWPGRRRSRRPCPRRWPGSPSAGRCPGRAGSPRPGGPARPGCARRAPSLFRVARRGRAPGARSCPCSWLAAAPLAVAAAPGLGRDLVEFGGRQDRGFAVAQREPVGAGQPLEQQRPVVGLGQVAAVGRPRRGCAG